MGSRRNLGPPKDGSRLLFGIIADEDTTVGFLLAGIGETFGTNKNINYMIVNEDTPFDELEKYFLTLYKNSDVGIILIDSNIWRNLRSVLTSENKQMLPIIVEIPAKIVNAPKAIKKL